MKYLVTGAAGFIGSRFVKSCQERGIGTLSADRTECFGRHSDVRFGDTIDFGDLLHYLPEKKPKLDAIVHMGALSDTTESDVDKLRRWNTDYTRSLWEYASRNGIAFVYASSAATYGAVKHFSDDETLLANLKPLNEYGKSKHEFDMMALVMEGSGTSPPQWAGLKFFNVYGRGEQHKGRMASMAYQAIRQVLSNNRVCLFKSHIDSIDNGHQKRDFVHVDDCVEVVHWCISHSTRGIYNVGTGRSRTFLDLVRVVFSELGVEPSIEWVETPEELRDQYQYFTQADISKLRRQGYHRPFSTIEQGIKQYVRAHEVD